MSGVAVLLSFVFLITAIIVPAVHCWGYVGHQMTAAVASHLLLDGTAERISVLLARNENLTSVAAWADEIKKNPRYRFTSSLHYVNPKDDEPHLCRFDYQADCPGGKCIVGAIFNYSSRANPRESLPRESQAEALKFLVHFIGDIHQPLHVSGRGRGGNDADVRFGGSHTNLHSLWDSALLAKRMKDGFHGRFQEYLDYLLGEIKGTWSSQVPKWRQCKKSSRLRHYDSLEFQSKDEDLINAQLDAQLGSAICPDEWAKQINVLNCETVWQFDPSDDLIGEYYKNNAPVVDMAIAKGGVRLAAVLNEIFMASPSQ